MSSLSYVPQGLRSVSTSLVLNISGQKYVKCKRPCKEKNSQHKTSVVDDPHRGTFGSIVVEE